MNKLVTFVLLTTLTYPDATKLILLIKMYICYTTTLYICGCTYC